LEFEYVVLNRDYEHLIPGFQNSKSESRRLLRLVIVVEDQGAIYEPVNGPELYYVYPKEGILGNQQPVQIMVLNECTYSVPANHFVIYASTILDNQFPKEDIEKFAGKLKEFAISRCFRKVPFVAKEPEVKEETQGAEGEENKPETTEKVTEESTKLEPSVVLFTGFLQRIRGKNQVGAHKNVHLVDDDDFGIDFDEYFERAQAGFHHLLGESRKMALSIKTSDEEFDVAERYEEEEDENHPVMKHLEALDKLRGITTDQPAQEKPETDPAQIQEEKPKESDTQPAEKSENND